MSTGLVSGFAANAFGPRQLATARHIGIGVGATVRLNDGTSRQVTAVVEAPDKQDTTVLIVDADLPTWSPVAPVTVFNAVDAMFVGAGLTPGDELRDSSNALRGWYWGGNAGQLHWTRSSTKYARQPLDNYEVNFDGAPGFFAMTAGDSGGGFYTADAAGHWYLQGIGVGIYAHNGVLEVDGKSASEFDQGIRPSNAVYQSNQMIMPRAWLRSLTPQAGDADFDGQVGFADLLALAQNYDQPATWSTGDFTGDGVADFDDLLTLAQNYASLPAALSALAAGSSPSLSADFFSAASLVPEPSAMVLAASATFMLRRRRRVA